MTDGRESKRARQACLNCRRKKARCSGQKPVCAFCARLNQRCEWNDETLESPSPSRPRAKSGNISNNDASLAARVALLESKLYLLGDDSIPNLFDPILQKAHNRQVNANSHVQGGTSKDGESFTGSVAEFTGPVFGGDFFALPYQAVLLSLIDIYFNCCHNQPYTYFHERTFRNRFEEGVLPDYLMYALAATACRFSEHEFYKDRQAEAIEAYASASWAHIFEHSFTSGDSLEIHMVQATSMLAVVDFTGRHEKLGWVKFGLSLRFAQGLRLNEEPDERLSVCEQEERRRTFWSVYLLDQLMSLGPSRPPSMSDIDCHVRLPCHEDLFRENIAEADVPTLEAVMESPTVPHHQNLDHFAMTIVMASTLGSFLRSSFKRSPNNTRVPWDPRSKFYMAHSILLHFESHSPCTFATLSDILHQQFALNNAVDQQQAGHFVFSHALFHLNHCLLNHPFILHHVFQRCPTPVPPSFVREALQRCYLHATELLDLLRDAQHFGHLVDSSFYGYCAMAAGIIHRLFEKYQDPTMTETSGEKVQVALSFLDRTPIRWKNHAHMASLLRSFYPSATTARGLIDHIALSQKTPVSNAGILLNLLDYGSLSEITPDQLTEQAYLTTQDQHIDVDTPSLTDMNTSDLCAMPRPELVTSPMHHFGAGAASKNFVYDLLGEDMGGVWMQMSSGDDGMQQA